MWNPLNIFCCPAQFNHAVIILNNPINLGYDIVLPLWKKAQVTVTVDGGTNHWINYLGEQQKNSLFRGKCKDYVPTLVTGDMDSICPELLKQMEKTDAIVLHTPDQSDTDFTKALMQLHLYITKNNIHLDHIYVFVDTSGRFDHIISNINTLYKTDSILNPHIQVIQISSNSMTWVLKPGKHKIHIPDALIARQTWCSLIPFGTSTSDIRTTGLKWNLDNIHTSFGGLLSTSNTYNGNPEVTVITNEKITWSMGIEPFTKFCENSDTS
ncbi:thiamin pyrophosphokinase 1-like isoform X2 [Phymastichus coffea]|uniref:thiamin pyrophosphokinase 1-like isoform X2 n=1 Tax=Phymastichus coffea TaxID=108790 RepID=UPI00273B585A|nr:thiamin pyrophosphokinase 1-like isoform X2 [Phymastichus coffea]XP_058809780.1 thiamin pyrophosphokinase 1-like isoform X2 [Phymastichus coffea]